MKKRILWKVSMNFILHLGVSEILLFVIRCLFSQVFPSLFFSKYITQYYWVAAFGLFALVGAYFGLCALTCLKRYKSLCKSQNISDEKLLDYYNTADKCHRYSINNDYLFIDTPHGIICMTIKDVSDYDAYKERHAYFMETTYDDDAVYVSQENDYYSYHFKVVTRHGTFNNSISNYGSLSKLNKFFEQKIPRAS